MDLNMLLWPWHTFQSHCLNCQHLEKKWFCIQYMIIYTKQKRKKCNSQICLLTLFAERLIILNSIIWIKPVWRGYKYLQGRIQDFWKGGSYVKWCVFGGGGVFILLILSQYPMKIGYSKTGGGNPLNPLWICYCYFHLHQQKTSVQSGGAYSIKLCYCLNGISSMLYICRVQKMASFYYLTHLKSLRLICSMESLLSVREIWGLLRRFQSSDLIHYLASEHFNEPQILCDLFTRIQKDVQCNNN